MTTPKPSATEACLWCDRSDGTHSKACERATMAEKKLDEMFKWMPPSKEEIETTYSAQLWKKDVESREIVGLRLVAQRAVEALKQTSECVHLEPTGCTKCTPIRAAWTAFAEGKL